MNQIRELVRTAVLTCLVCGGLHAQESQGLALKSRIELSGVRNRIDHLSADLAGQRLFVSALGNHTLEVFDVKSRKRLHSIKDLAEPQGVYYDAPSNRIFVACAADGTTRIFDGTSYQPVKTVKFSSDADNIRYYARDHRVIVGYGDGALGFLDANGNQTGTIPLHGHPESFQTEKNGLRAFVNVPDRKEIEVVNLAKSVVVANWPVTSAVRNFPMALDEAHHRVLIGCRSPARMLAIDAETGASVASVETVGDADDLFYDAGKRRVYVIGGQGFVDVFDQKDADHYARIGRYASAPGARTGLFVPEWRELFVAAPHRGEQSAEILVYDTN